MPDDRSEPTGFLEILRGESTHGPGHGIGRFARLLGGGAGLARRVMKAGRGAKLALSEKDLRKLEALVRQLGELKGLPMKFGQIMSYLEVEMPEEMRRTLALLQTQSPATPRAEVERVLLEDLGARGAALWGGLDPVPASIASIGQVYRGRRSSA
jgi:predicted unusual protein kinase regulating ubiquinone biosynthesis (AarF/ABC1/UbiB family)